ncbi:MULTISPECIES: hypothetical protein [unclassified Streptomyces]|uniref:hypothetical protein n=1 Tax=unclassified Streptomyces TaxID=2593676 RepID=UPI000FDC355D|nr:MULTISPECIES: hypothetical protein [unclassified Streptomyces]MBJ6647141.1 hypothetical protein [Streptomyces sp. BSE7-9]
MADEALPAERTALEDLKQLARVGVTDASLMTCRGLTQLLLAETGSSQPLSDGSRSKVLHTVLSDVAAGMRKRALEKLNDLSVKQDEDQVFQGAAAAELIGITDEATFTKKREDVYGTTDEWQEALRKPDNRGSRRERQLRASVWIEQSRTSVDRKENELLAAFEAGLKVYIASHRDELRALVAEHQEVAAPPVAQSATPATASLSNSVEPTPVSKAPTSRKRWALSLSVAFLLTAGSLALWRPWEGEKANEVPLNVNATWPLVRGCDGATNIAMQPSGPDIQAFPPTAKTDIRSKMAASPGGGSWLFGSLVIDLSGKTNDPVQIRNITYKTLRDDLPAPKWIYEPRGGCGGSYIREFVLDLDAGKLLDKGLVGEAGPSDETPPPTESIGPAFTVSRSDPAQITVSTHSCAANYEWELIIDYFADGVTGSVTLGPYRSMGVAKNTKKYFIEDRKTYKSEEQLSGPGSKRCTQMFG